MYAEYRSETGAFMAQRVLGTKSFIKKLIQTETSTAQKVLNKVRELYESFKKRKSKDAQNAAEYLHTAEQLYLDALSEVGGTYQNGKIHLANREEDKEKSPAEGEVKWAKGRVENARRIAVNMSETDRAEILRECSIEPIGIEIANGFDINFEQLEKNRKSVVEKALVEKLRKLGFLKSYKTDVVDVEFEFTGGGLRKSMNSQVSDYGGNLADLAKVVMNMQELLDQSVLLEVHSDKAKGTDLENPQLVQTFVLLSAFQENGAITPVQFEIKQYVDNNNRLYLAVALTKIKTGVMDDTILENQASTHLLPVSTISIPDLVKKINPRDENFFKYIPNEFLDEVQLQAKRQALERETKKYGRDLRFSRKATGEVVTLSKGQLAALQANYHGEKVFTKKDVTTALKGIDALQSLPAEIRKDFVNRLWTGYNQRLHAQGFEQFTEVMWHHLHATVLQENGFEMTEAEIAKMDEQIVNALHQIVASGKQSIKAKLESATSTEGYRKQANYWREEHTRTVERNKLLGRVKFEAEKLANMKAGRYVNAANYKNQSFAGAITELARMNWRGGLVRDQKIREHFAALDVWYSKENPLYKGDGNGNELFRQEIKDALSALGNAQNGALTNDDLLAAETVIKYFAHEIEAHNTVYKDGKRVDAMPEAKRYVENVARAKEIAVKCGLWQRLTRSGFARMVADPAMLMRQADGYLDGFFTEQFEQLRQGTIDAAVLERELAEDFEKFWDEHKAYGKRYNNANITFDGKELPLQEAISLYMTMKREHAFAGLAGAGFEIDGKDATENVSDGFVELVEKLKTAEHNKLPPEELLTLTKEGEARIEQAALEKAVAEKRKALFDQFTAEDKALISLMEKTLEQCRDMKVRIDEIVQGYSNVTGGYYFPIKRTGLAENVDAWTGFEGDRVSNLSINKDTVKNAHKLFIEPAHIVFMRHVKAISLYHGLGVFTDNFNRLYNLNTVENVNNPTTVRTALGQSNKYAKEMLTYFKELKQDVEGISKKRHTEKFYNDAVARSISRQKNTRTQEGEKISPRAYL